MEKYINMNDSFGGKNSASSTKSFLSSYEQCIETLKQQLQNHKKALTMAEKLVEQYRQQNQQLIQQIQALQQGKVRSQQKYEVLQNLFIKLEKQKEKQSKKETKRYQQKHHLQIETINARYECHIATLNERIYLLENELRKHQQKERNYHEILGIQPKQKPRNYHTQLTNSRQKYQPNNNPESILSQQVGSYPSLKSCSTIKKKDQKHQVTYKNEKQREKNEFNQSKSSYGNQTSNSRVSLGKKDLNTAKREKRCYNTIQFMRYNTEDDHFSQKQQILRTALKQKKVFPLKQQLD